MKYLKSESSYVYVNVYNKNYMSSIQEQNVKKENQDKDLNSTNITTLDHKMKGHQQDSNCREEHEHSVVCCEKLDRIRNEDIRKELETFSLKHTHRITSKGGCKTYSSERITGQLNCIRISTQRRNESGTSKGDQMKEDEIDRTRNTYERDEKSIQNLR